MTVERGSTHTVEVTKIVHGGFGLARLDGQVLFIPGSAPGDVVDVLITDVKKSHAFADVIAVVSSSPHRVDHIWPEADVTREPHNRVGGADFGHLRLDYQRQAKTGVIREALARQGSVDPEWLENVPVQSAPGSQDGVGWRTRVSLHVNDQGIAGQRAFHSHRVIPTTTLPLAHPDVENLGAHRQVWSGTDVLTLGCSSDGHSWVRKAHEPPENVTETVMGHTFRLDTDVFWQVHHAAPHVLTDAVIRAIDWENFDSDAHNLDLYGGVGLFAVALAQHGDSEVSVTSVEGHKTASAFATGNLSSFASARAVAADVQKFVRRQVATLSDMDLERFRRATVVLDPPRSGAGGQVISDLVALRPQQIVYVACDPVAFARDQKHLSGLGYELRSVEAFDLFPHTHHVEMVASFSAPQ